MELLKKKIHTERIKSKSLMQVPLEEDINILDVKPDAERIIYYRGNVVTDDIKAGTNKIWIKAHLRYQVLYKSDAKSGNRTACMDGELAINEEIYLDKIEASDRVVGKSWLEDFRVSIINSRKLSIQAIISFEPRVEETVEEEVCTEIEGNDESREEKSAPGESSAPSIEYRKKNMSYLESIVKKRDLLRIHEETKLAPDLPEISQLLYQSLKINNVSFKPLEDKISVSAEMNVFIIYTNDNDEELHWYETKVETVNSVDCMGCRDYMLADVTCDTGHEEITSRNDSDNEARIIGIEATLALEIRLFELQSTPLVADVYGVTCEAKTETKQVDFRNLYSETVIEEKVGAMIGLESGEPGISKICHCESDIQSIELVTKNNDMGKDGIIRIKGCIAVNIMYCAANGQDTEFYSINELVPFELERAADKINDVCIEHYSLDAQVIGEQLTVKDARQLEYKAALSIRLLLYNSLKEDILTTLKVEPINPETIEKLPGFVIYCVKPQDTLWQIGRKYYVGVDRIKQINNLTDDSIKAGDKLLIVK